MKHQILLIGAALAALTPSLAYAQDCERQRSGRVVGTVAGAGVGAVAGGVIAGRGDTAEGAIIGGVLGAIAGNQIAKPDNDCKRAYGWYDKQGRWHATGVSANNARGYYDRNGDWVQGQPSGYYENGRWVAYSGDADGYWDAESNWVPANAYGYYDRRGRWVTGTSAGYWQDGRWVAGSTRGYYDSRGRWMAGTSPSSSNSSVWSDNEQSGYYDSRGRWVAGRTYGYYDSRGRWIATRGSTGGAMDRSNARWDSTQGPGDASGRIAWLRDQVNGRSMNLSRVENAWARRELNAIEAQHRMFERSGGRMTVREEAQIDTRLDRLTRRIDRARATAYNN